MSKRRAPLTGKRKKPPKHRPQTRRLRSAETLGLVDEAGQRVVPDGVRATDASPPVQPDPSLIGNMEGDERARKRTVAAAEAVLSDDVHRPNAAPVSHHVRRIDGSAAGTSSKPTGKINMNTATRSAVQCSSCGQVGALVSNDGGTLVYACTTEEHPDWSVPLPLVEHERCEGCQQVAPDIAEISHLPSSVQFEVALVEWFHGSEKHPYTAPGHDPNAMACWACAESAEVAARVVAGASQWLCGDCQPSLPPGARA